MAYLCPCLDKSNGIVFDLIGSVTFIGLMIVAVWFAGDYDVRSLVIAGAIIVWALRLGPFLIFSNTKCWRRQTISPNQNIFPHLVDGLDHPRQLGFYHGKLRTCRYFINFKPLGLLFYVGLALWVTGFAIEILADRQKTIFRSQPSIG